MDGVQEEKKKGEIETYNGDHEEGMDETIEKLQAWRDELPYNKKRYTMIVLFTVLILIVVYMGYAYGGLKVCTSMDGVFDQLRFECHPSEYEPSKFNDVGMPFTAPSIPIQK